MKSTAQRRGLAGTPGPTDLLGNGFYKRSGVLATSMALAGKEIWSAPPRVRVAGGKEALGSLEENGSSTLPRLW